MSTYRESCRVLRGTLHTSITVGRTEELMEPPGGTHTTTDLYSKLSADPTIFAKLMRIKSEKADALAIGFDLAQWFSSALPAFRRQLFRTLSSSALRLRSRKTTKIKKKLQRCLWSVELSGWGWGSPPSLPPSLGYPLPPSIPIVLVLVLGARRLQIRIMLRTELAWLPLLP